MRHRVAHRKLGRVTEHRLALLRNQATALLRHERIETTVPKARELRPFVERLITIAKRGLKEAIPEDKDGRVLHARRLVTEDVHDVEIVGKLFDTIAPRFEARPGGYTRLLKLGPRRGDHAEIAQIELVGSEYNPNLEKPADDEGGEKPTKSAGGVRGRLRAAASRLRGGSKDKDSGSEGEKKAPAAPKRRVTTPRKAG
jgi:large subunit ribosomal protein L17